MITENEKKLVKRICGEGWTYDGGSLDFNKEWNEQNLEYPDNFINVVLLKDYCNAFGWDKNFAKGVLGSLTKKGLITLDKDGDEVWIYVNEKQFEQIKKAL